jgi:hypothetical protein
MNDLLNRDREGDRQALAPLLCEHGRMLELVAGHYLRNREQAGDIPIRLDRSFARALRENTDRETILRSWGERE